MICRWEWRVFVPVDRSIYKCLFITVCILTNNSEPLQAITHTSSPILLSIQMKLLDDMHTQIKWSIWYFIFFSRFHLLYLSCHNNLPYDSTFLFLSSSLQWPALQHTHTCVRAYRYVKHVKDIRISVFESLIRSLSHFKIEIHRKFPKTESLKDCKCRCNSRCSTML